MPQVSTQGAGGTAGTQQPTTTEVVETRVAPAAPAAPAVAAATPAAPAAAMDGARAAEILDLCQRHGFADLSADLLRSNSTIEQARAAILDRMDARDQQRRGGGNVSVQTVADEHDTRMCGMEEAILNRMDPRAQLTDNGRRFRGMSLTEMAREALQGLGVNTRGMTRNDLATAAFRTRAAGYHTTGDFPSLLGGVGSRRLRALLQRGQAYLVCISKTGFFAADGAHADALVNVIRTIFNDAVF